MVWGDVLEKEFSQLVKVFRGDGLTQRFLYSIFLCFYMDKKLKEALEKQHYRIIGNHSAVQICRWAKKSLCDEGFCYKQKFYNISSHRCCQMSLTCEFCQNKCIHCWRAIELNLGNNMKGIKIDNPKEIIKGCIEAQRKLLIGFKGNKKINLKKYKEAQEPMNFAISLTA